MNAARSALVATMLAVAPSAPALADTERPNLSRLTGNICTSDVEIELLLTAPKRRVRAYTPQVFGLLLEGTTRSSSFSALLMRLERSELIVQIIESPGLPPSSPAQLMVVPVPAPHRMVRIQLGNRRWGDDRIALLGHELFHAIEIADAPEVTDHKSLSALYRRIGFIGMREHQFDTSAAHDYERRIRLELGASRFARDESHRSGVSACPTPTPHRQESRGSTTIVR